MAERASAATDLTALLEQLRLQRADGQKPEDVTRAQVDLLLARISAVTAALRSAPASNGTRPAEVRLLLADLAMVAAQFRGNTTALNAQLTAALERARLALDHSAGTSAAAE